MVSVWDVDLNVYGFGARIYVFCLMIRSEALVFITSSPTAAPIEQTFPFQVLQN